MSGTSSTALDPRYLPTPHRPGHGRLRFGTRTYRGLDGHYRYAWDAGVPIGAPSASGKR